MKLYIKNLLACGGLLCLPSFCSSQNLRVDPSIFDGQGGYVSRWDSVQDKLVLYRNTSGTAPAARIFEKDGTGLAVYPGLDLPESMYIDVWDAAATPGGGLVLAAIVGYTARNVKPPRVKSLVLTYDDRGKLTKVWDMEPYHLHRVAVDRDGNVFALGDKGSAQPYPLILKYSPEGKVLKTALSSALFETGDNAIYEGSPTGDPRMFIRGDKLVTWIASTKELFRFDLDGNLIDRVSLGPALARFTAAAGGERAVIEAITTSETGDASAQVHLWPKTQGEPVRLLMIEASKNGETAAVVGSPQNTSRFLGRSLSGKLVFLEVLSGNKGGIIAQY